MQLAKNRKFTHAFVSFLGSNEVHRSKSLNLCSVCRANISSDRRGGIPVDPDYFEISQAEEETQAVNSESGKKTDQKAIE